MHMNTMADTKVKPYEVINGQNVCMEIDTGAAVTDFEIYPKEQFQEKSPPAN